MVLCIYCTVSHYQTDNFQAESMISFKVVLGGYHRNFFGVKVKIVNLIGGRRYLAVRSGLNERIY